MNLRMWLAAMLVMATLTIGGASTATAVDDSGDEAVMVVDKYGNTAAISSDEQVKICHVSPGNLKTQVNEVGGPAVLSHITEHGDTLFSEVYGCDAPPDDEPTPIAIEG